MTDTYVIRGRKQAWDKFSQYIYDVYADTAEGFADFFKDHLGDVSPASTVEVADLKATPGRPSRPPARPRTAPTPPRPLKTPLWRPSWTNWSATKKWKTIWEVR